MNFWLNIQPGLDGGLAPDREQGGGGQEEGGGAPEDCGGRHQRGKRDHEAADGGKRDVESGEDVCRLGPGESELRVDAEHRGEASEAVLDARQREVVDDGKHHQEEDSVP